MTVPPDLVIQGPIEHADPVGLSARVRELLARRDADLVVCDVGGLEPDGLDAVAMLAELQLTARRAGGRIEVIGASADLHEVLAMAGLCHALGLRPALCLEAGGRPNIGKNRAVSRKNVIPLIRSPESSRTWTDQGSSPPSGAGLY